VQDDGHLWTILGYIEANPVRAGMVADPGDWPWSSYPTHGLGIADPLLSPPPGWSDQGGDEPSRQASWRRRLATVLPESDLKAIRSSLTTGRPHGDADWAEATERLLNPHPIPTRPRGRPRKA